MMKRKYIIIVAALVFAIGSGIAVRCSALLDAFKHYFLDCKSYS